MASVYLHGSDEKSIGRNEVDLETARGVKQELLSFIDQTRIPRRDGSGGEDKPEVAMGFSPKSRRGDLHIAVRAESEKELPKPIADELRLRANKQIDIRYTGRIAPLTSVSVSSAVQPLTVGVSIAHYRCAAGTLGFFARRVSDGAIGVVSNNHVIAASDLGIDRDEIVHGGPANEARNVIAHLSDRYPRIREQPAPLDCAFAPLVAGVRFDPSPAGEKLAEGLAVPTAELTMVSKFGSTTRQTFGRVTAFELDEVRVTYPFGRIVFHDQIEIESAQSSPFSRPGDSGSLVFTMPHRQPLGLIFGGSLRGGPKRLGLTYANPIRDVVAALGVTLIA